VAELTLQLLLQDGVLFANSFKPLPGGQTTQINSEVSNGELVCLIMITIQGESA
jgi:hypothetical protein